jgi:hypothetical protein
VWGLDETKAGSSGYGHYAGGYYYYSSYYGDVSAGSSKTGSQTGVSGIGDGGNSTRSDPGRPATFLGRLALGVLVFVLVIALAGIVYVVAFRYLGLTAFPLDSIVPR